MNKIRLISSIIVKDKLAVQSFNYDNYLPLGKVQCLAKNFDRWNSDEILINCIDRSLNNRGPDFDLLKNISKENISTPIIYGGGIRNAEDAVNVIKSGADRVLIETLVYKNFSELLKISKILGSQALILSLPLVRKKNVLRQFDYINKENIKINKNFELAIKKKIFSEILLVDKQNEGSVEVNIDLNLLRLCKFELPLIYFGGLNSIKKILKISKSKKITAVAIGNSLNYSEHRVQNIKEKINRFRKPYYF